MEHKKLLTELIQYVDKVQDFIDLIYKVGYDAQLSLTNPEEWDEIEAFNEELEPLNFFSDGLADENGVINPFEDDDIENE